MCNSSAVPFVEAEKSSGLRVLRLGQCQFLPFVSGVAYDSLIKGAGIAR